MGCCRGFGFREGGGGVDLGLGSVGMGCCRGFGFREGGGGVDLVAGVVVVAGVAVSCWVGFGRGWVVRVGCCRGFGFRGDGQIPAHMPRFPLLPPLLLLLVAVVLSNLGGTTEVFLLNFNGTRLC
uniref:Uncharacterized protein n=1 Tax=Fagus sylvatica TaxID=28930 RepID=A0A2N9I0T4_FAGSY